MLYRCKICNYIYDEEEHTKNFNDLDKTFRCPKCRAAKNHFRKK